MIILTLAQLVERVAVTHKIAGSSPAGEIFYFLFNHYDNHRHIWVHQLSSFCRNNECHPWQLL